MDCASDLPFMLLQIQANVQGSLNNLDADVANAAQNLSTTGIEGDAAREVLHKLLDTNSNLVEALTFSKDEKIISVVECEGCNGGKNNNTSGQDLLSLHSTGNLSPSATEVINQVLKTRAPSFSKVFKTVEGVNGTDLAYPVISPEGELLGGIGITIETDKLLNAMAAPELHFNVSTRSNITDYSSWMLHPDGLVAYDRMKAR